MWCPESCTFQPRTQTFTSPEVVSAKSQVVKDGALQVVGGCGETAPKFCWVLNGHGMCLQWRGSTELTVAFFTLKKQWAVRFFVVIFLTIIKMCL